MKIKLDKQQADLIANQLQVNAAEMEMSVEELRGVDGGLSVVTTMAVGEEDGGWASTMAVGEEDICIYPPIDRPIKKPPIFTTMAVGEEDGGYIG